MIGGRERKDRRKGREEGRGKLEEGRDMRRGGQEEIDGRRTRWVGVGIGGKRRRRGWEMRGGREGRGVREERGKRTRRGRVGEEEE